MPNLENRIPPPIIALITLLLIILTAKIDDIVNLPELLGCAFTAIFVIFGLLLPVSGIWSFRKAQTTVNPLDPTAASNLVTSGVFRYTRNPMYLGMLLITLAVACYTSSLLSLAWVLGFIYFISRFQIAPEERAMQNLFGDEFDRYKKRVRRWI